MDVVGHAAYAIGKFLLVDNDGVALGVAAFHEAVVDVDILVAHGVEPLLGQGESLALYLGVADVQAEAVP